MKINKIMLATGMLSFVVAAIAQESSPRIVEQTIRPHFFSFADVSINNKKVVVLGSSTAAGAGATHYANGWAGLYERYLKSLNENNAVINLAVPGYTTYQELPTGATMVSGRPGVDNNHNITAAILKNPDAIIVNLPTNDIVSGYHLVETEANLVVISSEANKAGIPIWITTSQPRNLDPTKRTSLAILSVWIKSTYGPHAIDFWSVIANMDGTINPIYCCGDGIHLNNFGHYKLYGSVVASRLIAPSFLPY